MQENAMRNVRVFAVTVNMGVGESGEELKKAQQIIEKIFGFESMIVVSHGYAQRGYRLF